MNDKVDRETIHQALQEEDLEEALSSLCYPTDNHLNAHVRELGQRVGRRVNTNRLDDFRELLEASELVLGYLALLYEAENGTTIEQVLNQSADTTTTANATR